jgi:hypothetical protein
LGLSQSVKQSQFIQTTLQFLQGPTGSQPG